MFLRPTLTRLLITAALLLLAYGGYVQSEGFTDKDAGQPTLPLARLFESIPHLWELWVMLLAPARRSTLLHLLRRRLFVNKLARRRSTVGVITLTTF
jgi:hypothetical protein